MPKNPPPPKSVTVRLNGCSRVQKLKRTLSGWPMNGTVKPGAEAQVAQVEDADRDVRQRQREARVDALGGDVEEGRIGKAVERDQIAQRLDEAERPDELDVREQHVDVHLGGAVDA